MQPLNQRISEARKAQNMTQEQLAQAMHVSRQTVSHWENGRMTPDDEAKKRLYALLNLDDESGAQMPVSAPSRRTPAFLAGFVCGALAALLVVFGMTTLFAKEDVEQSMESKPSAAVQAGQKEDYDWTWYQQANMKEEGKAYLSFSLVEDPVTLTTREREPSVGWMIDYRFQDENHIGFTMKSFTEVYYTEDQSVTYSATFKDEELSSIFDSAYLSPNTVFRHNVFKPVDASVLYAVRIEGVDDNGNECVFRYTVPLQQEMPE